MTIGEPAILNVKVYWEFEMKWKLIIGIVLIILSLSAMFLWETRFRDELMLSEVLVAAVEINEGDIIDPEKIAVLKINPEAKLDGALTLKDIQLVLGKESRVNLKENQQLSTDYFAEPEDIAKEGLRQMVIPAEWIHSKTVLLQSRDIVSLYTVNGENYMGTYRVGFISPDGSLEILAKLEDYLRIFEACTIDETEQAMIDNKNGGVTYNRGYKISKKAEELGRIGLHEDGMPFINKLIIVPERVSRTYSELPAYMSETYQ